MSLNIGKILGLPTTQKVNGAESGAAPKKAYAPQTPLNTNGLLHRLEMIDGEISPESRNDVLGKNVYYLA